MSNEQKVTRKLRAILSADVKGYSLLMADDEVHTIQTLKAYRQIMADLIQQHSGRVVDNPGDNLLAVFESAVDAVVSATEIQKKLKKENAKFVAGKRLQFRIGVNIGDIVHDDDSIYGSGVNVAARIEGIADPGGICISRNTYDHVKDKLDLGFDYLGGHEVKNIKGPVRVYKVLLDSDLQKPLVAEQLELPDKPSIAVLPFTNMSEDPEQEYFSDGITEDIITALSSFRSFSVIARNSTFIYKGQAVDVRQIAEELGARYVVEGSIRKAGNRVRITAQLIDATSGNHIWAERYDRHLEDIFAVQDEIVETIAGRLGPEIDTFERHRAERKPTRNLDAWGFYHLGLSQFYKFSKDGNSKAQTLFRRAVELDPKFAPAYSRLAYSIVLSMVYFDAESTPETLDDALVTARTAVEIDDKDAWAHLALGRVHLARCEYDLCIAECDISIKLNPYLAQAHCALGDSLAYMGRFGESISRFEEAIRLTPHDPWRWGFLSYRSLAHLFMKQHEAAAEWAQKAILVPNCHYSANANLVTALGHLGRIDDMQVAVEELLRKKPGFSCSLARKNLFYIKSSAQLEHYLDGLRKAGLPD